MSEGAAADAPSIGYPHFDDIIRESQTWLAERGQLVVGSGCLQSDRLTVALHTDYGPEGQDKASNQDYALAWCPPPAKNRKDLRLVVVMADGLTTSFRSECGATLACWVALRALAEAGRGTDPLALAKLAANEAGLTLGQLGEKLALDPEASCPPGQFPSTWKYILNKGGLFQTTLTLAWLDRDFFHVAMVGDGGALWRGYPAPTGRRQATDRLLAQCDLTTHAVRALGPADRHVREFDCWHKERVHGPFLCALHSDGVGRGLGDNPLKLLDELERLQADGAANPAQQFIRQAVEQSPKDFEDNLTLAVVRAE